jgi:hypothetical protein
VSVGECVVAVVVGAVWDGRVMHRESRTCALVVGAW